MSWFDEQIKQRKISDQEVFEDSFMNIASTILDAKSSMKIRSNRFVRRQVIDEILTYYHYKPVDLPETIEDFDELLEYALRPHGIMRRNIKLEEGWYKDAYGIILAFRKEDGAATLLYPLPFTGYYYHGANGEKIYPNDVYFSWVPESEDGNINYTGADDKLGFGEIPGRADFVVAVNHISRKKYPINWKIGIYRTDNDGGLGSKVNGGSPRPWNIAKFSEFYLIAAEAAVMLGNNSEARELVNVLRARAGKQTFNQNDNVAVSVDKSAEMVAATPATITIDFILDERSREYWGEGYRWFDLVRTQKWGERATVYHIADVGYTDKELKEFKRTIPAGYYIRPIPQGQLDGMEMEPAEKEAYQNPAYRN